MPINTGSTLAARGWNVRISSICKSNDRRSVRLTSDWFRLGNAHRNENRTIAIAGNATLRVPCRDHKLPIDSSAANDILPVRKCRQILRWPLFALF